MPIPRTLFEEEHNQFRDTVRRFMEQEVAPHHARWAERGHVGRAILNKAGEAGFLCSSMPEEYGGGVYRGASRLPGWAAMGAKIGLRG